MTTRKNINFKKENIIKITLLKNNMLNNEP